jgi:hypothetical protein
MSALKLVPQRRSLDPARDPVPISNVFCAALAASAKPSRRAADNNALGTHTIALLQGPMFEESLADVTDLRLSVTPGLLVVDSDLAFPRVADRRASPSQGVTNTSIRSAFQSTFISMTKCLLEQKKSL